MNTKSNTLQTTERSIEILEYLLESDGSRVSELADAMDIPKSTIHGHLATLEAKEFVIKRGDIYVLGPELLRMGTYVRSQEEGYVLAGHFTDYIHEKLGFRSAFAVEMGGKATYFHTASGDRMGWAHEKLGNRLYLHNTAIGKAILAELPRQQTEQILDKWGLPAETKYTITDRDELFNELEEVRDQGYATNHEENIRDLHALGVAATDRAGKVIGGFSVNGPKRSFTGQDQESEIANQVSEIVNEFELELAMPK
ncbi:IclR family transcriptional regulator [Haloarcula marina]|uniref:IclR family transcriptional regulator n=1 Tax=Haloarcula marina TaxID=2961574 RepID=UPI0020B802EC|nr:IclR family transcriptional regulator [Halomicroarcula marina]